MKFFTLVSLILASFWLSTPENAIAGPPANDKAQGVINFTSIQITPENCGMGNGSIVIDHDGTAPFTYTWTGTGGNGKSANNLSAGNYTIKVEDSGGCEAETTLVVTEILAPSLMLQSKTDAGCNRGGTATVVSSDPSATATWNTTPPQTGYTLTNAPAGQYTLTAVDAAGCTSTLDVNIDAPQSMQLGSSTTADTCGSEDGTATVTVLLNGVAPFTYQWGPAANNQTTATANNLAAGQYKVTVVDADGCDASRTVTVQLFSNLTVTADVTPATCFGGSDATVKLNVMGGNGSYSYNWNPNVSTSAIAQNLEAGSYKVTVTDILGNQCETTETITVDQRDRIQFNIAVDAASGCGVGDGSARISPTNVQGPYVTSWDTLGVAMPFLTGVDAATNLYPGIYGVSIIDSAGCTATRRFVVTNDNGIDLEVEILQEDKCGKGEGIARADQSGGTSPFRYKWFAFPAQGNDRFAYNLEQGDFFVVIADKNDCVSRKFFTMPGRPPLKPAGTNIINSYCDIKNGSARVSFDGGTTPYTYAWNSSPPQNTGTAVNLGAGKYRVVVTDVNGCQDSAVVALIGEAGFTLDMAHEDISCFKRRDGSGTATPVGGFAPYTYLWNTFPVQTTSEAKSLTHGDYTVIVTDARGCVRSGSITVEDQDPLIADFGFSPDTLQPILLNKAAFAFQNRSIGADFFVWSFGDGKSTFEASPVHIYQDTGHFYVTLTVSQDNGRCSDRVTHGPFIVVDNPAVYVPSAFTPNADGNNDILKLGGVFLTQFDFAIYDRWGQQVFYSNNIDDSWDGQLQRGGTAPEGVYIYTLRAVGRDGLVFEEQGTITLIR